MQYTTNLLLKKPESEDGSGVITDLNYNWDILDAIVHALNIEGIWKEFFTDVAAASATAIHAAITGNGAIQNITTAITNPGEGRNATITGSASAAGIVVLSGLVRGVADTESITIVGGSTVAGNKPFDTITNIKIPAELTNPNTVSVGFGDKFGLLHEIDAIGQVYKIAVNAVEVTGTYAALVNATYGTIDFSTVGVYQDMVVWYYQIS